MPEAVLAMVETKPDRLIQQEVRDADGRTVCQPELRSLWIWRKDRSDIRKKESWLVCGDQVAVDDFEAKKTKLEDDIKALEEEIARLQGEIVKKKKQPVARSKIEEMLGNKQASLKTFQTRLKERKGTPISLRKFLEEVVLPHAWLSPPTMSRAR